MEAFHAYLRSDEAVWLFYVLIAGDTVATMIGIISLWFQHREFKHWVEDKRRRKTVTIHKSRRGVITVADQPNDVNVVIEGGQK